MIWSDRYWRGTRAALMPGWIRAILLGVVTLLLLALVGAGISFLINTLVVVPAQYDRLANHGVRVEARIRDCTYSKGTVCWLSYSYGGTSRTVMYGQDGDQFGPVGTTVVVLVDPADPSIVYTEKDVRTGYRDWLYVPLALFLLSLAAFVAWAFVHTIRRNIAESGTSAAR